METKKCSKCGFVRPFSEFSKGRDSFGLHRQCKVCDAERYQARKTLRTESEVEARKTYEKEWRAQNADRTKKTNAVWRKENAGYVRARKKAYYVNNKDAIRDARNARYAKNGYSEAEKKKRSARARLRNSNFTQEQYEYALDIQGNKCAICGTPFDNLPANRIHADHCHVAEAPRGVLCGSCNHAVGLFKDSIHLLEKAVAYLKNPPMWGGVL